MGLSDGWKSFQIGLAVLIQYRSVTDTHPPSQPARHVAVAITLYAKASSVKTQTKNKLETKASSTQGQCIPAGCRITLPRRVLITMSVITMRSIFRKLCVRLFTLCKISTAVFESCGAIYRRICEMFSALQSTYPPLTNIENSVQIDA